MKSYITVILVFFSLIINAQTSFQDNLTGEEQGEFPSRWDLIQGSAEVASLNGGSIIYLANKSIITPLINSKNYLSNNFTLEFDAFYDGASKMNFHQYYEVRFWDGHSYLVLKDGKGFLNQLYIYCNGGRIDGRVNGAKVKYDGYRESLKEANNVWRHIKVNFNNDAIKVFIDDILLVNIPKIEFNPTMISIGVFTHEYADFVRAIKNVSLTGIEITDNNPVLGDPIEDPSLGDPVENNTALGDPIEDNSNGQTNDISYTLPTEDGDANQILQADGNGTVNWVDHQHDVIEHEHESNTPGNTNPDTTNETATTGTLKIDNLLDGKSDGSSIYLGVNSGASDDNLYTRNVGLGFETLKNNDSTGYYNVAVGYRALSSNTTGNENVANGFNALFNNTTGRSNIANGSKALFSNTTGENNTANGATSLYRNTTGENNSANGVYALNSNTTGNNNVANGVYALVLNTTGSNNTANGTSALYANTTGDENVANGFKALYHNTTGDYNTAIGYYAMANNSTGSDNTAIGYGAQVPDGTASNQVRIGNTYVTYAGIQVAWTVTSDKRWKENIRELPYGLDVVKQLKPVDYMRINNDAKTRDMGFIAQDVEALLAKIGYIDQGFLTKDDKGLMSLRYNDFIALLTKAIQEQQKIIENQDKEIQSLTSKLVDNNKEHDSKFENLYKRLDQLEQTNNQ